MPVKSPPKVSVAILTYNRPYYLRVAMDATLAQTFTDFELLICDNGSAAETKNLIDSYTDSRIRYLRNEVNSRDFFNEPFRRATGEYLLITHDDDQMHPAMLAKEVAVLDAHQDCVGVGCNVNLMDDTGMVISPRHMKMGEDMIFGQHQYLEGYFQKTHIYTPSVLMRRAFFRKHNLEYDFGVGPGADAYLWFNVSKYPVTLYLLNEVLFNYRVHSAQDSIMNSLTLDVQLFEAILADTAGSPKHTKENNLAAAHLIRLYFSRWMQGQIDLEEYRQKVGSLPVSGSFGFKHYLKIKVYQHWPQAMRWFLKQKKS